MRSSSGVVHRLNGKTSTGVWIAHGFALQPCDSGSAYADKKRIVASLLRFGTSLVMFCGHTYDYISLLEHFYFCWKFQLDQSGPAEAKFGEIRFCLFTIFIDLQKYRLRYFKTAIMVCTSITLVLECIFSSCIISLNQIDVIKQSIRFWSIMIDDDIQRKWKQLNWLLLCKNSQIHVFFFRHQLGQESTLSNFQNIKLAKYT